jgi:cell division protein ZapA (FtsZ GTPase activity inhibitor)
MSAQLRVDTEELRMTANKLDMHAAELCENHAVAHADMISAIPGFGTALSAAALSERISQWEQETAEHQGEIERHGEGHRFAGASYSSTDSDSGERINAVGGTAGTADPVDL